MSPNHPADTEPASTTGPRRLPVPDELADRLAVLLGLDEPPATLGAWLESSQAAFDEAGLEVGREALVSDEPTRHQADLGSETVHTYCLMDGLVLPFVVGGDVELATSDPWTGEAIRVHVDRDGLEASPETAVMSVGAPPMAEEDGGPGLPADLDHDRAHDNLCPYINGFRTRENHQAWADEHRAVASTAVPVDAAYELARGFVQER